MTRDKVTVIELVTILTEMMEDDNKVANMAVEVPNVYVFDNLTDIIITDEGKVRLS